MKSKLTLSTLMACLIVGNVGFADPINIDNGSSVDYNADNYSGFKITNNSQLNINANSGDVVFDGKDVIIPPKNYNTALYAKDSTININADKLTFQSLSDNADEGYNNLAGWFAGDTKVNFNVNELYIGESMNSYDCGFQFKGNNNILNINSDKIVAYVGDQFINAQVEGDGERSVVNIGTVDDRINHFEAHATFDDGYSPVALLQANEGSTINLYADTAILDGSHDEIGGVIGSGSWGTVNVVANNLTIDGNICGTYGTMNSLNGKTLELNVTADNLSMEGDINLGNIGGNTGDSRNNRDSELNLNVNNGVINGNINILSRDSNYGVGDAVANINFAESGQINGTITVEGNDDDEINTTVNLGGNADMTSSKGFYDVSKGGNVNFTGGTWAVNKWSGDGDGNIKVCENATLNINSTITVAKAVINGDVVIDTDKVTGAAITANKSATLSSSSNIILANVETGDVLTTKLFDGTASNVKELNSKAVSQMKTDNLMLNVTTEDGKIVIGVADASKALPDVVLGGIVTSLTANRIHNDFFDDVLKSGDAAKASEALNSVANMGELAGVNHGTYSMSNQMTDAVADHLSIATHVEQDNDIWAHYIHNKEDIDGMDFGGVDGSYEAQYNGIVIGSDLYKNGKTTAGIALSYADGNINGSNFASSTKNEAEYYGASLYGRIDNGNSAILGDISYMHSDNDITQNNSAHEITASADADAFSIGIRAEQAYEAGAGKFVPYAGIRYMHLGAGDYSNSLGMEYNADDQNLWLLPVGVTYSAEVQSGDWTVKPIAEVGYVWTMGDRDTDQTVSLNGASDTFGFETADSGSFIGRLGIEAEKADVTYGLSYEYQKGDTVKANKWMVNLTYSF